MEQSGHFEVGEQIDYIPGWKRVISAKPDFLKQLQEAVEVYNHD